MPSVVVTLPAPFIRVAGGLGEIVTEGETVALALGALRESHPALVRLFLAENGEPRRGVSLFLNGSDVGSPDRLDTRLAAGDRLAIVLLMAGG